MNPNTIMPEVSGAGADPSRLADALLDCVAHGIVVISSAGQVLAFNAGAARFLGLSAAEVLGRPASVLPAPLRAMLDETLASGGSLAARPMHLVPAEENRPLQVRTTLARDAAAQVLSVLIEFQPAGRVREIATNLEHLERLANLGALGAGVAHEIKNALVAVRTFVDLLQEREKDDELAMVAAREIMRIDAAVRQMLRGATHQELTLAPVGLNDLINDSLILVRHQFKARAIQLKLQLQAEPDRIQGDERQLRHAFVNLLMNALDAVRNAGDVSVVSDRITTDGRACVRVTITDTGSGVPPENMPRLFHPFFTTKKDGTGLGLAITRSIVQAHGGSISVESPGGQGAVFQIVLPGL